jgi:hypothetical protein
MVIADAESDAVVAALVITSGAAGVFFISRDLALALDGGQTFFGVVRPSQAPVGEFDGL